MNLRDRVLSAQADRLAVPVPEWNAIIHLRKLTLQEALGLLSGDRPTAIRTAQLVALTATDDDGNPIFQPDDGPALASGPFASTLLRISAEAMRFNALDEGASDRLGKASNPTPGAGSPSDSPANSG